MNSLIQNAKLIIYWCLNIVFPNGVRRRLNDSEIRFPIRVARFYQKDYEPEKHSFILRNAFGVAVDGGAHIGYYSVLLARNCQKVIAFEPTNSTRTYLESTLRMNDIKNVEIRSEILSSDIGFSYFEADNNVASVTNRISYSSNGNLLRTISLDSLELKVDFLKLDIEGAEILALRGAKQVLTNLSYLSLEIHPRLIKELGYDFREIFTILGEYRAKYFFKGYLTEVSLLKQQSDYFEINVALNGREIN